MICFFRGEGFSGEFGAGGGRFLGLRKSLGGGFGCGWWSLGGSCDGGYTAWAFTSSGG